MSEYEDLQLEKLRLEVELIRLQIIKARAEIVIDDMFRDFYDAKERALKGEPRQLQRFLEIGEQLCLRGIEYGSIAQPEMRRVKRRLWGESPAGGLGE